jgi:uncharacterized membrane protein YbhN (UPF0104 family)
LSTESAELSLSEPSSSPVPPTQQGSKSRLFYAQVVLTLGAFGFLFYKTDIPKLRDALAEAPWWSVPVASLVLMSVIFAGTVRWHLLMASYGARNIPALSYLFRLQLIGLFYNMMPGAVGGDVLRGVVSRHAFGPQGMGAGITVVLVERIVGLLGLIFLVALVLVLHPIQGLPVPPSYFLIGLVVCLAAIVGVALGRRFVPYLPAALARHASSLPALSHPLWFALAVVVSILNQALVGVMGHTVISPLAPQVHLLDSLALSPMAFAAVFIPITVAGAGTRDGLMIAFYGLLSVPREKAGAASIEILGAYILIAALGGALSLITPLRDPQPADAA